jgi:hypothetical protein
MTNIAKYWDRVREARAQLETGGQAIDGKGYYMTSLSTDDGAPEGLVNVMLFEAAARAIADRRARLSTDEEIKAHEAENSRAREVIRKSEFDRLRNDLFNPRLVNTK